MKYEFKTKPYQHQANALKKIFNSEQGHALFMDPGTGKTKIAVDTVGAFHQRDQIKKDIGVVSYQCFYLFGQKSLEITVLM